jgi:hypothetical protein
MYYVIIAILFNIFHRIGNGQKAKIMRPQNYRLLGYYTFTDISEKRNACFQPIVRPVHFVQHQVSVLEY